MEYLEKLLKNQVLWVLELEKSRNEKQFLDNLNVLEESIKDSASTNVAGNDLFTEKETKIFKILTGDDFKKYEDLDKVFTFAVANGYNPLNVRTNAVYEKKKVSQSNSIPYTYEHVRTEIQSLEMQQILASNIRKPGLLKAISLYIDKVGGQNIVDICNKNNFDIIVFAEKNKIQSVIDVLPKVKEDLKLEVVKEFFNSPQKEVTANDFNSLSRDSKSELLNFIKTTTISRTIKEKVRETNTYYISSLLKFATNNEAFLSDREKSELLFLLPQDYYYTQMSKLLKLKINGPGCENLLFASLLNSDEEKKKSNGDKFRNFTTDSKWLGRAVLNNPKFSLDDKYNDVSNTEFLINVVSNIGGSYSLFKDLNDTYVVRNINKNKDSMCIKIMKLLQGSEAFLNIAIDSEKRKEILSGNNYYNSHYFQKNIDKIIDKVGEDKLFHSIVTNKNPLEYSLLGVGLNVLLEHGISIEEKFNNLSEQDYKDFGINLIKSFENDTRKDLFDILGIVLSSVKNHMELPAPDSMKFKCEDFKVLYKSFHLHQKISQAEKLNKNNDKDSDCFETNNSFKM